MRIALLEELGFPDLDPVVSIEAKLRRAGKVKRLVIENGVEAEVNAGLVATNFLTRQAYSDFVKPLTASIDVLLRKEIDLGSFDLIYAAGIYDCLQDDLFRQTGTSPLTKPPLTSPRRRSNQIFASLATPSAFGPPAK
jgi:hypothetical protein